MLTKNKSLFIFILILFTIFSSFTYASGARDISNHWAQDYILNLLSNDIMSSYDDGNFKPNQAITRGEFSIALARHMNLVANYNTFFDDLVNYPEFERINALVENEIINGYPDDTFRPDQTITRAEMVAVIIRSLGVNNDDATINLRNNESFSDVPDNHWASNDIKIAEQLNLVSGDENSNFNPTDTLTRAETAKVISQLSRLKSDTGYITDVYPSSNKVSVNSLNGQRNVYDFNENTLVGRNNRFVELDEILSTDRVFIITDTTGQLQYAKAYGMVTQDDLATEISTMTQGFFQADEVMELSQGNFDLLQPKLQNSIREQLGVQGLSAHEINAIMSTDWDQLEELSRDRVSEAIAIQTGLPLDITRSLINGDWQRVSSYAQIELIQRLINGVLGSGIIS
ncbi:S-layer homology domain-containing protein [Natronospora cellulosivora (SeqCode)]